VYILFYQGKGTLCFYLEPVCHKHCKTITLMNKKLSYCRGTMWHTKAVEMGMVRSAKCPNAECGQSPECRTGL